MARSVSDTRSHPLQQLEHAARELGKSAQKWAVFEAVNFGKQRVKTLTDICRVTGLDRKRAATIAKQLAHAHLFDEVEGKGEPKYEKVGFYQQNKERIRNLAKVGVSRQPNTQNVVVTVKSKERIATARLITIDDINSFSAVQTITNTPRSTLLSEAAFKQGIQRIIGEPGTFQDWGGERNDLYTTRVRLGSKRCTAVFGFKGPGLKVARAWPKHFGKNGDQIQTLFTSVADLYVIQYWRQLDQSVFEVMSVYGNEVARKTGRSVYICVIDGTDTNRLIAAYPGAFNS